jgi:hypothetical protein
MAPKVLAALEEGNFKNLPEAVYVVGFIKKLAAVYEIPADDLVLQYHREVAIAESASGRNVQRAWKVLAARLAPVRWAFFISVFGGLSFVALCAWQIFAIGTVPRLSIQAPLQGQRFTSGLVLVSGSATPGSEVALNGHTVYAGADGLFTSEISFLPGTQTLSVSARSRFGKVAARTVTFLVEDSLGANKSGPPLPNNPSGVRLEASAPVTYAPKSK